MGIKEMQIYFDNAWATYYCGSKVAGRLVLTLNSPKKIREMKVKFKGEAEVKWSETESTTDSEGKSMNRNVDYVSYETYFENKYVLLGETEIPSGTHNYDFTTILPPVLPSSYEGQYGHIRYTVKVTLDRPWKFDQECKAAFTVICPVDLNYIPEARAPIRLEGEKSVGILCCSSGPLSMTLTSPLSGYTPGQTIAFAAEVENHTNVAIPECLVTLQKVVTYKSKNPSPREKIESVDIETLKLSALGAHSNNSVDEKIVIPALPATNTIRCNIMSIVYNLTFKTVMSGMFYRGLTLSAPLTIGTVPLINFEGGFNTNTTTSPQIGWTADSTQTLYPNLPLPSYEESIFGGTTTIQDKDDNEHTTGIGGWIPRYPTFDFNPSAPPAPQK